MSQRHSDARVRGHFSHYGTSARHGETSTEKFGRKTHMPLCMAQYIQNPSKTNGLDEVKVVSYFVQVTGPIRQEYCYED
jgi:hypothetical protein